MPDVTEYTRATARGLDALDDVVIDLEVTSVCDAVCTFCPREFMPDKKRFIAREVVERLAERLRREAVSHVVLCGVGEPTLHPELDWIVRTLAETGTPIEMTTHGGARMDVGRFGQLVDAGLRGVNFSLNAATAESHRRVMRLQDFEKTAKNVREILERKMRTNWPVEVNVSCVVCDLNEHEVIDFVEMWRPLCPTAIWLHPLNNRNRLLSETSKPVNMSPFVLRYQHDPLVRVDLFGLPEKDERVCRIARKLIFMTGEGVMRLCAMDYRRATSLGNVHEESLHAMHTRKIARWIGGDFDRFCEGCDFCPRKR